MKKVLIITYYWPPNAGVGVQRWLKFSKFLPEYGWQPIIFTPENPDFNIKDKSLDANIDQSTEVLQIPIWEPFSIFDKITGGKNKKNVKQGLVLEKSKPSWKDKIFIWIRGNLFIPDPRRFWVKPAVKFLEKYIKENNIQAIVTTGPPHSMHLIGLKLKQKTGIKWLADFRDPWSHWDLHEKLLVGKWALNYHKKMECRVLHTADTVVTVSNNLARDLGMLGGREVDVITNGVDEDDFSALLNRVVKVDKFRISYFGLLNEMRDPTVLWEVLTTICLENVDFQDDLELNIGGIVSETILGNLKKNKQLSTALNYKSYIPHKQVFEELQRSALLLVILNKTDNARWIIPAKLFEYLVTGKEILLLGPKNSDAANVLAEAKAGVTVEFDEKEKLKAKILKAYQNYKSGNSQLQTVDFSKYSRKKLTGNLSVLLEKITADK